MAENEDNDSGNGQDSAESQSYKAGKASAKYGSDSSDQSGITNHPDQAEHDAAERGYEDQTQAEEIGEQSNKEDS